jgi:phasin family protein
MTVFETIKDKAGVIKDKASVIKDKAGVVLASVGDLNELAIEKVEEASKLSLSSAGYFCDVSIKQMRAASSVRDMDSLRKFTADSISLGGEIAKKMLDDSKAWMTAGTDMKDKVGSIFKPKEETVAKKKPVAKSVAA